MISFVIWRYEFVEKVNKANRTRQVQFRMDPVKFKKLYSAIIHEMHSMADLFNKAADEYLKKKSEEKKNGKNTI